MAEEKYVPRLKTKYNNEVKQQLQDKFQYENVMMIPKFEKIVVNMGVGEAATDSKAIDGAVRDLRAITYDAPMASAPRPYVGVLRSSDLRRDPPYPRLPRHLGQELRRPW